MNAIHRHQTRFQEDGSATLMARVCASDGTGAATGVPGEGNWVKQADLSSITCKVFNRSSSTPDTATTAPTITISSVIQDTPVTSRVLWDVDYTGYNFVYAVDPATFATGGDEYLVEMVFTSTGGAKWTIGFEGLAEAVVGS